MAVRKFRISAQVSVWTDKVVTAQNYEEALLIAKSLGVTDFVTIKGDHMDSKCAISGISDAALPNF